jgi:hypothetical protein
MRAILLYFCEALRISPLNVSRSVLVVKKPKYGHDDG